MNPMCKPKRRGFSLPELLTVIGLVGVLIALLLPALRKARSDAIGVKCLSNLRQLLQGQMMYVAESGGYITYPNWDHNRGSVGVWSIGWLYSQEHLTHPLDPQDVRHGALYPYLGSVEVYHCPAHDPATWSADGTDRLTSYIMNGAACGFGAVGVRGAEPERWQPSRKITEFTNPTAQVLWWEADESAAVEAGGAPWNDGASRPDENRLARRHGRGATVGCFDGHVEWMDRIDYVTELQRPGPNRLWCDPGRPDGGASLAGGAGGTEGAGGAGPVGP